MNKSFIISSLLALTTSFLANTAELKPAIKCGLPKPYSMPKLDQVTYDGKACFCQENDCNWKDIDITLLIEGIAMVSLAQKCGIPEQLSAPSIEQTTYPGKVCIYENKKYYWQNVDIQPLLY
tara:strand:- start:98 stop:463 length:366 start_codon:yes stop_codon:yes gene_type:complete